MQIDCHMYESPQSELVMCHMSIAVGLMRERERERVIRFKAYCTVNDGQS
jgi:hypothetical protein